MKMAGRRVRAWTMLTVLVILSVALLLRLRGLSFGLPALLDPDEPIFVLLGLKLLRNGTLNPGWFGHPGSTTIYMLAAVEAGVYGVGHLAGRFPDPAAFARAIYSDPSVVFLPGRILILVCGLACVWLTWRLGERLFGLRTGLLGAAFLALDPLHVRYSQIIRTDVQASMFVLLALLGAVGIAQRGRMRDFVLTGIGVGIACATKWPAATVAAAGIGAWALRWRDHPQERSHLLRGLSLFGIAAVLSLLAASPFILLDYPTVLSNLHGEERPRHLGATGAGPLQNLWWYVSGPLVDALGVAGLVITLPGLIVLMRYYRSFRYVIAPVLAVFLLSIVVQHLVWERWVVPLLPLLAIAEAHIALSIYDWLHHRLDQHRLAQGAVIVLLAFALALPPIMTGNVQAKERLSDTRGLATAWAKHHIPAGSSVAVEYLAFDILPQPWRLFYPGGDRGCIDARRNLASQIQVNTVDDMRAGRALVDLGNIPPNKIESCRADFLIIANWDRYAAESSFYPSELATYAALLKGGEQVAVFRPQRGKTGGPVVRVWRLQGAAN